MHRPPPVLVVAALLGALLTLPAAAMAAAPGAAGSAPAGATSALPAARTSAAAAKQATAVGYGGAVATVDADATRIGLEVLRRGGNAVDAAVAAAAALGVTEPFSAGIGGGGYLVHYDAGTGQVQTLDGRETGPASLRENSFTDRAGRPLDFEQARVGGLSVGIPGTLATWQDALSRWGTASLAQALGPAEQLARTGFRVDRTFHDQIAADPDNPQAFATFSSTKSLFLPGGRAPVVGSTFRNPDLADTYRLIAGEGASAFYSGAIAADIVRTVQHPPLAARPSGWPYRVLPGGMTGADLRAYRTVQRPPTAVAYRGLDVYGMAPSSSGGTTVGEALNILQTTDLSALGRVGALHRYLEASALAFADRGRYVGDPAFVRVPRQALLSQEFADTRACLVRARSTLARPVPPGVPGGRCGEVAPIAAQARQEGLSTTNLTVADRFGNVVEYTLTIEQTGGSAMVVPGRGFLLNNELTDFSFTPTQGAALDPNLPAPGKRPRSSISPTIVLRDGRPFLALGSPGGSTIITTVLQVLLDRVDLGLTLPQAVADPRVSERNLTSAQAEPAFLRGPYAAPLRRLGHDLAVGSPAEIGAATAIEFLRDGRLLASAEPVRRGGGSAAVVRPAP